MRKTDVVFINLSQNGIKKLAPVLAYLSRCFGKKVVIRPFGSSLKSIYQSLSGREKLRFSKYIIGADILFVQTKELQFFFKSLGKRVLQLKTSRPMPDKGIIKSLKSFNKRFVYLGQIREDKGLNELIACRNEIKENYTIDVFGPIEDSKFLFLTDKNYYKGLLKTREELLNTLSTYDVLVLPTYYEGEGYPGVIVEAYSLGLPVITTDWKSIPEIVIPGKTGILVKPRSASDLKQAIMNISEPVYNEMSQFALNYYTEHFEMNRVMTKMLDEINGLFNNNL